MKCVLFVLFLLPAVLFSQGSIASSNQSAKEAASGYTVVKNNARGASDFTRMGKKYLETKDTVLDFSFKLNLESRECKQITLGTNI